MVDKYGQIVASDDESSITISIDTTSISNTSSTQFPPFIEGQTTFKLTGGVVEVDDIAFAATPGQNYSLKFGSTGIDTSKVSNKNYM